MIHLKLFLSFLKLGMFSFGGGYAMIALLEQEMQVNYPWIAEKEIVDILAISEMTPGSIAINAATFFGYRVGGVFGAAISTMAVVLPSFIIMNILIYLINKYKKLEVVDRFLYGVRPIILGLIISGAYAVGKTSPLNIKSLIIFGLTFYLVSFKKFNAIYAMIFAGIAGAIIY